jgi:hypothetical protein
MLPLLVCVQAGNRNDINQAIETDHSDYTAVMGWCPDYATVPQPSARPQVPVSMPVWAQRGSR